MSLCQSIQQNYIHLIPISNHAPRNQEETNRDIRDRGQGQAQGNDDRTRGGEPELEFAQTTDERSELLIVILGMRSSLGQSRAFFKLGRGRVSGKGRVEFGLEEGQEEVEKVDEEAVCDCQG